MALPLQVAPDPTEPRVLREPQRAEISVALADDRALVARGMRLLLERDSVIAVNSDFGGQRRGEGSRPTPDVIVFDVQIAAGAAILAVRQLRQRMPGTAVVVVTGEPDPVFARQALAAGAAAIVLRRRADTELSDAVRRAGRGELFVSPPLAAAVATLRGSEHGAGGLSLREVQVLRLIALGHTSAEIAEELNVSRRTIDSHRASIHRKLGLATRAELVQFALGRHLIGS